MTAMLASVRTVEEALLALEGGADIIDLKDPARGALGALDPDTAHSIVGAIAGRVPSSATIGDLPSMIPAEMLAAAERTAASGVNFVKAGFFSAPTQVACAQALTPLAQRTPLVAVLFADLEPDFALIETLAECGFAGAMLDTARKNSGPLLRHLDLGTLAEFVRRSRAVGLFTGLAGSLREADVGALLALDPDYLGFRGALCAAAQRAGTLDANAFGRIRAAIPQTALPRARGRASGAAA
jgi:(5-formylfuran-3-yl)methyl phosphate synthase